MDCDAPTEEKEASDLGVAEPDLSERGSALNCEKALSIKYSHLITLREWIVKIMLSLVESFIKLKYFHGVPGPALLCHKEPAGRIHSITVSQFYSVTVDPVLHFPHSL